jgi:membrane associated rhomboid family serine protease
LARTQTPAGIFWVCSDCNGRAVTVSLLRRVLKPEVAAALWRGTFTKTLPRVRPCPSCQARMQEIGITLKEGAFSLDVCRACQFVWFDPAEYEALPTPPSPAPRQTLLPQTVREAVALAEVDRLERRQREAEPDWDDVRNIPAVLGLPVELDPNPFNRRAWATWFTAFAVAVVSILLFWRPESLSALALVPAEWMRGGGVNLISSFFVHGGIWHLLSNLYFLFLFGDNVEGYLGHGRWLGLLLAATLAGGALHIMTDPRSDLPCVGASGGISGLMAFYALRFPKARLGMRLWLRYTGRAPWFTFPVWGWFAFWMAVQLFGVLQQVSGFGHVSALAHVGGALAGFAAWVAWRKVEIPPEAMPAAEAHEAPPSRRGSA